MTSMVRFAAAGMCLAALLSGCEKEQKADDSAQVDTRALVKVAGLAEGEDFCEAAEVQGTFRTKFSANVSARIPGSLEQVYADEGQTVTNGTPLFQVDRVNLLNKVRLSQDDLNVAKAMYQEAVAAQTQAKAAWDKAKVDVARMKQLWEVDKAVTKDTWEKADLQFKSADAALKRVDAALETARVKIVQAETALSVAQKTLSDSLGVAPFTGIITRKLKDAGDFVSAGTPVFSMDNPDVYEVCFSMNALDYDRVAVGKTQVMLAGKLYPVTYKSPSVHPVTRTFEARITVPHEPQWAPGMILDGQVMFRQYKAAGVPSTAVGLRGGKTQVFVVKGGKASAVDVKTGAVWQGQTEIQNADALKGAEIVTEGMLLLNDGDAVRTEGK
jgi:multidrug efflux pump subunit AcrA (membrane-fusion protein)